MKLAARRTTSAIAALATVGVTGMFAGAAPAAAAPSEACGLDGTLIGPGICELVVTTGGTFVRTAQMTRLEVLLVGAGGSSSDQSVPNTSGYAAAGGGGAVTVVDFSAGTTDLTIDVADATDTGVVGSSSVDDGGAATTAANGTNALSQTTGGTSGTGFVGASSFSIAGGGGASASPVAIQDGGAGQVVSALALSPGSLFATDDRCFGGGGAASNSSVTGVATCGGGSGAAGGASLVAPIANSGGGAGGTIASLSAVERTGSDGVAIVRWTAATVTLGFSANGHGTDPASQAIVAGNVATAPAAPVAPGYDFTGWFTDASLTTPADFSAPVTGSTTYFAGWSAQLAATGVDIDAQVPLAAGSILLGGVILLMTRRRRRSA